MAGVAQIANSSSFEKRELLQSRVSAALFAVVNSPRVRADETRTLSVIWNLIVNNGNWRKVVGSGIYWLVKPEQRLSVIPLAASDSIAEGFASHSSLKELCLRMCGDRVERPDRLVFSYLTALLVGYTIHRQYETADHLYTKNWLKETAGRFFPEVDAEIQAEQLQKFRPFLEKPGEVAQLECPVEETVMNVLVAIHEKKVPPDWKSSEHCSLSRGANDLFLSACRR